MSRFCIKKILPGQHHCGIPSHKNKKYPVQGGSYWAPGGYVRGELVALGGEFVLATAIPPSMKHMFGKDERRSTAEWRNIIIDAAIPNPSLHSVDSEVLLDGEDDNGNTVEQVSLLGREMDDQDELVLEDWIEFTDDEEATSWYGHVKQQRVAIDGLYAITGAVRSKLGRVMSKINREVVPHVNAATQRLMVVSEKQVGLQESMDHVSTMLGVLEQKLKEEEGMRCEFEDYAEGVTNIRDTMTMLESKVQDLAASAKATEGVIADLIQKVSHTANAKLATVVRRVSALEAKTSWVRVEKDDGDESRSVVSANTHARDGAPVVDSEHIKDWTQLSTRLSTLEAKVEIQLERSKRQGVIFHKVAFSSEMEFMLWYLKENTSGKGLASFVDLVSVWSFASLSNETASEWLQALSRQKTVGLDNKVEVEYSHSMSTRYPAAFVGKAELITSTQTFKIFEKLLLWRGGGVGDGVKERLLDSLRMAVERQRVYCEDMLPAGVVRDHAIRSAEFTRDFFQAFVVHAEDEITMLTSFGLGEAQVMLLMSNQLMQICDDLFEFRHAAINVANSNRSETAARYAWVTLQALGKMSEYRTAKFKHHPSITGTFVRFLTRQTADTSAVGLKAKLEALESTVKTLKSSGATKTELEKLHNKLDLIVAANDLKKK